MPAAALIRLLASLGLGLGLASLYLRWRNRTDDGRTGVATGWGLIALGLIGWTVSGSADVAVSDGIVALMVLALGIIAYHATTLAPSAKAVRARPPAEDNLDLGRGYWSRVAARLMGCVFTAPAAGLMAGALWYAWIPGDAADRLMMMAVIAVLVLAIVWVVQLASRKPWRTLAVTTALTLLTAGLVYWPHGGQA
jgi:uncharacterized membrane protein YfcA